MRPPVRFLKRSFSCAICFVAFASYVPAQTQPAPFPSDDQFLGSSGPISPEQKEMEHKREKAMNKQRFDDLKKDTDKLLELATELKQNVDRANENVLSLDVVKKADEIDKLAKQIREKMKGQ